jgi:phosphoenolpyruvate-protein phosphotransferase/dihydroxyacetone kinase phosphotransfer subunit
MVGIVLVSHSAALAEATVELARQMGGEEVKLEAAGGLEEPGALGTDAMRVLEAIDRAWSDDGVLVLMDLGSAVLSAETALDFLPEERRGRVLLSEGPFVEAAVAAAVAAKLGSSLEEVAAEARGGLVPKEAHLGAEAPEPGAGEAPARDGDWEEARLAVRNPLGLHARPAARLVQTVGSYDADVEVENATMGRGPVSARSLNAVATLGVRQGHEVVVRARGAQGNEVLTALQQLADDNFGDDAVAAPPQRPEPVPVEAPTPADGLAGLPASPGVAIGPVVHFTRPQLEIPAAEADDPEAEWRRLEEAIAETRQEITRTRDSTAARAGEDEASIFDAHLLLLEDDALLEPAREAIEGRRANAARAWQDAVDAAAEAWRSLEDDYLRERAQDVLEVGRRVSARLLGVDASPRPSGAGILVAADLAPGEAAALHPEIVRGIATAAGGPTSHAAILARALGVPAVVGAGTGLLAVAEGATVLVDGDTGGIQVDPSEEVVETHRRRREARERAEREAWAAADQPAVTRDGTRIEVAANVSSTADVELALRAGAEGVGLLRTEFLFLDRATLPDEEEQAAAYREIAAGLRGRPLILRTLDVGADKPLPSVPQPPEANPFLGVRGVRLGFEQPSLLRTQLRAALRVAAEFPLKVMFPMVAGVDELRRAKALLDEARAELHREGVATPGRLDVGVMIEVPSAALTAERLAKEVDFFSIGTNDLSQYTLAAERGNPRVAALADPLHPAVLQLIAAVTAAAERHGRWVGVCGEAAGDPLAVPLLIGLGVHELSATPRSVPLVKQVVRGLDLPTARHLAERAQLLANAREVRDLATDEAEAAAAAIPAPASGP